MLSDQEKGVSPLNQFFDTFFHFPTLLGFAIVCVVLLWRIYDLGFYVDDTFVQVNSNRGNVMLLWGNGCCQINW